MKYAATIITFALLSGLAGAQTAEEEANQEAKRLQQIATETREAWFQSLHELGFHCANQIIRGGYNPLPPSNNRETGIRTDSAGIRNMFCVD